MSIRDAILVPRTLAGCVPHRLKMWLLGAVLSTVSACTDDSGRDDGPVYDVVGDWRLVSRSEPSGGQLVVGFGYVRFTGSASEGEFAAAVDCESYDVPVGTYTVSDTEISFAWTSSGLGSYEGTMLSADRMEGSFSDSESAGTWEATRDPSCD